MHPTAGVVADELLRGQVEASMTPVVDARIPPASGPDATATDVVDGTPSGTPPATVLVADAFDCGRVEVVPLPIAPANIPSTLASAATTVSPAAVAVGYDSARSQVEDVPMPFVQVMISLGSVSASASAATTPLLLMPLLMCLVKRLLLTQLLKENQHVLWLMMFPCLPPSWPV